MKLKNNSVQLLLGNRFNKQFLFYLSLMRDYYKYDGTLTSSQFSTVNLTGHSLNYGASLGIHLSGADKNSAFFKAEAGVVKGTLNNHSRTAGTAGGAVGWSW